jgi:transposase
MPQKPIPANKLQQLLHFGAGYNFNKSQSAKQLRIARSTATKYIDAFKRSELTLTDIESVGGAKIVDLLFPRHGAPTQSDRKVRFLDRIASIHSRMEHDRLTVLDVWREEVATKQLGYKYSRFASLYASWLVEQGLRRLSSAKRTPISVKPIDAHMLKRWRRSHDRRKWEVGIALQNNSMGISSCETARKIERSNRTVEKWCLLYGHTGIASLPVKRSRTLSKETLVKIKVKKEKLIKIIHESPRSYNINRASWSLQALSDAYCRTHGERVSTSSISEYFISAGYKFKKAKKVLTSDDPTYRDKLANITSALSHITPSEKFFSIDEFGPFSVKLRGGVALVPGDEVRTIPQRQKSKGSLICTAALELSTNQVTHFYSKKKNTGEMVKLLRRLVSLYRNENRLFISWDSASWHASKALYKAVDEINTETFRIRQKTPLVDLMPLPSGAQFLNVIESVF